MKQLLMIGLGGALGAVARFFIGGFVQRRANIDFPVGTLAVNLVGCLLLGITMEYVTGSDNARTIQPLAITGFLGALTTFSTFGFDTIVCFQTQGNLQGLANVALSVAIGIAAVALGLSIGSRIFGG